MIVSFDTGADYDVAFKEHVTRGWCGFDGGLRGEIWSFVIYLCFVLVWTNLGFIYLNGSMLYLFYELDHWVLFEDLLKMFDDVVPWGTRTYMFYNSMTFYDTLVFMKKSYMYFH